MRYRSTIVSFFLSCTVAQANPKNATLHGAINRTTLTAPGSLAWDGFCKWRVLHQISVRARARTAALQQRLSRQSMSPFARFLRECSTLRREAPATASFLALTAFIPTFVAPKVLGAAGQMRRIGACHQGF